MWKAVVLWALGRGEMDCLGRSFVVVVYFFSYKLYVARSPNEGRSDVFVLCVWGGQKEPRVEQA